jgi:hypothetical protein
MKAQRPIPKEFDSSKYQSIIDGLSENMPELEFEKISEVVVYDILENYEKFENIEKGPDYRGTPFDFFGFKNGVPYIIEYKGSLNSFNTPGETQKRRLREVLQEIDGLKVALIQVKLKKGEYRFFDHDDMKILFKEKHAPIKPIVDWINKRV